MLININKIKELKEKKVKIIDLSEILGENFDIILPFKAKGLDEQIKLLSNIKYGKKYTGVKNYMLFRRTPKDFQDFYLESQAKNGSHELLEIEKSKAFVLIDPTKDEVAIEDNKILKRLMNVVIHIDMDHEVDLTNGDDEPVKGTMWEAWEIKKGDYLALAKILSGVITNDYVIKTLEYIVDGVKADVNDIKDHVRQAQFSETVKNMNEDERAQLAESIMAYQNKIKAEKEADENGTE